MREILFKARRLSDGEWVEGYYIGPIGVLDVHEICDIHDITGPRVEVDPSTVCQYTGLTDKNGKRIFENDIITTKYGRACKVTFKALPSFCGFDLDPINGDYQKPDRHDIYLKENLEVIGTVFDEEAANET